MSIPLQRGLSPGPAQPLGKDWSRPHVSLGWLKIPYFAVRANWDLSNIKSPPTGTTFALVLVWDTVKDVWLEGATTPCLPLGDTGSPGGAGCGHPAAPSAALYAVLLQTLPVLPTATNCRHSLWAMLPSLN